MSTKNCVDCGESHLCNGKRCIQCNRVWANTPNVTNEELTHIESIVLFHYGYKVSGFTYQAGKFQTTLIEAIILADLSNQARLKLAYPNLVLAVQTNDKLIKKLNRLMSL